MPFEREIEFARRIASAAGANARRIREGGITAETKADASPVTVADKDNERLLREAIEAEFPADGILGEEGSSKAGSSGRRWIIDPIDGTRDFVRGNRFWCVLIALEDQGEPVLGLAHFALLEETYWAARGVGSFLNDERLQVSTVSAVEQCVFAPNGLPHKQAGPYLPAITGLIQRSWSMRAYGGALDACHLAAGKIDLWYEAKAEVWDLAPLKVIIEEAGGVFRALDGSDRADRRNCIGCTPGLLDEARRTFGF